MKGHRLIPSISFILSFEIWHLQQVEIRQYLHLLRLAITAVRRKQASGKDCITLVYRLFQCRWSRFRPAIYQISQLQNQRWSRIVGSYQCLPRSLPPAITRNSPRSADKSFLSRVSKIPLMKFPPNIKPILSPPKL